MFKNRTVDSILEKFRETILHLEEHADVSKNKSDYHIDQHQIHFAEFSRAKDVAVKLKALINA